MLLYRKISDTELYSYIHNLDVEVVSKKGENTFTYEKDKAYIHFYKYFLDACHFSFDNSYIMIVDIPEEIINKKIGIGNYLMSRDRIEYCLEKSEFNRDYIVDFCKCDGTDREKALKYNNKEDYIKSINDNEVGFVKSILSKTM